MTVWLSFHLDFTSSNGTNNSLSHMQLLTLSYIGITTSSLSILGAASIVVVALVKRRVCIPEVNPICQLSLADSLAAFFLLLGAIFFVQKKQNRACLFITSLSASFFLCTFLLTFTYAVEVYTRIRQRVARSRPRGTCSRIRVSHILSIIAWVVPVTLLIAIVAARYHDTEKNGQTTSQQNICDSCLLLFHYNREACWNDTPDEQRWHIAGKLIFLIPLLLVMIGNLIFYILALVEFRRSSHSRGVLGFHEQEEEKRIRNKTILYQLVFCVSWLPSLVLGFISLDGSFKMKSYYGLYVVQMVLSPLQGFWNCIIYGWQRKGFKQALNEPESAALTSTNAPTYSTFSF